MENNIDYLQDRKNFIWNIVGLTCNCMNSFFFLIIVTRVNGVDQAGIFSYAFAIGCLFYFLSLYYNRIYQVADSSDHFTFSQYLTTRIITSIFSVGLVMIFAVISRFAINKILVILLIMLYRSCEAVSDCFYGYFQKKQRLDYVGISLTAKAIFGLILFLVSDLLLSNILFSLFFLIFANMLGLILYDIQKFKSIGNQLIFFDFSSTSVILKETFPVFAFSFIGNLIYNVQKYILTYYVSNELQTIFGIIVMPATVLALVGNYLLHPFINRFVQMHADKNYRSINKLIFQISSVIFIAGLVVILAFKIVGVPILSIIYGLDLYEYKNYFIFILMAAILGAITSVYSGCLTVLNVNSQQLYLYICSAIISILLSVWLINLKAICGAVYAYCLTMLCHFIIYTVLYVCQIIRLNRENNNNRYK